MDQQPRVGELRYVVVRQEGHAPASVSDGIRLCDTTDLSFRDSGVRPGIFVFYSVFTERWKALSTPSASAGLFTAIEVRKLGLVAGDGIVSGSWEPVAGGSRVFVTRKEGAAPAKQRDGTEIRVTGSQGFVDSTVKNGQVYYYRVSVEYTDPRGGSFMTSGRIVSASPDQPPAAVQDLRIALTAGSVELVWSSVARGSVRVYRRAAPPAWQVGARIPATAVSDIGAPARERRNDKGRRWCSFWRNRVLCASDDFRRFGGGGSSAALCIATRDLGSRSTRFWDVPPVAVALAKGLHLRARHMAH